MRKKLIELRKAKKLTQSDIAKLLGVARPTYNAYELGTIMIPLDNALKLKEILQYYNDDLFTESRINE